MAGLDYRMILFGPIHQGLSRLSVHKTAAGFSARDTKSWGDYTARPECFLQSADPARPLSLCTYKDVETEKSHTTVGDRAIMSPETAPCSCGAQESARMSPFPTEF